MPNITGLTAPSVGDSKNTYPTKISDSFTAIDNHDHTSGKGVQIPTGGIVDLAVTAAKLAANAVTTAKILDANVTRAKLASVGEQRSTSESLGTTNSADEDLPDLTVDITTTGRPVFIGLIPDGTPDGGGGSTGAYISSASDTGATGMTSATTELSLFRDGTEVARWLTAYNLYRVTGIGNAPFITTPPGSIWTLDSPSADTYTYQLKAKLVGGGLVSVRNVKLVAFEL